MSMLEHLPWLWLAWWPYAAYMRHTPVGEAVPYNDRLAVQPQLQLLRQLGHSHAVSNWLHCDTDRRQLEQHQQRQQLD